MYKSDYSKYLFIGLIVALLFVLPYFYLGEGAFITIHDFLDSNPVHVKSLISIGLVGNLEGILPILDGVSAINYMPIIPIDIKNILYLMMPLYWAIVCNMFFVKVMAFLSMYLLCFNYIIRGNALYSFLVAVIFCLIPFYADYGLSSAGVPLFLYCVYNLEFKKKLLLSYVLITFFACNSSLVLVGIFLCVLWGAWILLKWLQNRKIPTLHIYGLMILVAVYLFANISIIYNYFLPSDIISHRVEFASSESLTDIIAQVIMLYLFSQYHAGSFFAALVLLVSFTVYGIYGRSDKLLKYYLASFVVIALLIFIGTLVKISSFTIFNSFQFDRFYFLYPSLCFILLAKAYSYLTQKRRIVFCLTAVLAVSTLNYDSEFKTNVKLISGLGKIDSPTYKQFFDTSLFSQIKRDLNADGQFGCKVASVGMFPSIAEYNSFYTVDTYTFSYSLDYKHKFRNVISKELDKDDALKSYFDDWGSRCYVFSSELKDKGNQYLCSKKDDISVNNFDINTKALKDLGCEYILSAVDIKNYKNLNLAYVNSYTTDQSYWNIRVYKLN